MTIIGLMSQVFVYLAELHQRKQQAGQPPEEVLPSKPKVLSADPVESSSTVDHGDERARTVDLAPSKKRTKGKKSFKDRMTACSVA